MSFKSSLYTLLLSVSLLSCDGLYTADGVVIDQEGNPIASAEVYFYSTTDKSRSVNTDENGEFSITYISGPAGADRGYLLVYKEGYKKTMLPYVTGQDGSATIRMQQN